MNPKDMLNPKDIVEYQKLEKKYNALHKASEEQCQAYHHLANIMNKNRHKSESWKDCDELTCTEARHMFRVLETL